MDAAATSPTQDEMGGKPYRWNVEAFQRLLEAKVLEHPEQIELFRAKLLKHPDESPCHAWLTAQVTRRLRNVLLQRFIVYGHRPFYVADHSEPRADVLVVRDKIDKYKKEHPRFNDVTLLVEIAVSSADYDLGEKALLYAQASIGDYWVVLPERQQIVVHREPSEAGYKTVTQHGEDGAVTPLAAPQAVLPVRELLGR